ncbi:MAG: lytic transglycosylase domain-containing protein [Betaproteobacteria bacterium]|nr:lytic transglycosylase domain-containing protein [Betaproteobacteria bacterium]
MSGSSRGGFSVVISATDNASKSIAAINKRFAEMQAPAQRLGREFNKLSSNIGLRDVGTAVKDLAVNFEKVATMAGRTAAPFAALAGAGGVAGIVGLARSWASFGSNLYLSSRQAGVSVSTLQGLGNAAQLAGGSAEAATSSFVDLNKNIQLARAGHGDANFMAGLGSLGINWQSENSGQIMDQVLHKLAQMHNAQQQLYYGNAILGGSFSQLWPVVSQGTDALNQYMNQGQQVGVLTEQQAEQAMQLRGDLERLGLSVAGLGNEVVSDLAPGLDKVSGGMAGWIEDNRTWLAQDIAGHIKDVTSEVQGGITAIGGWHNAFDLLLGYVALTWSTKMISALMPVVRLLALIPGSGVTGAMIAGAVGGAYALQGTMNSSFSQLPGMTASQQQHAEASALAGGVDIPDSVSSDPVKNGYGTLGASILHWWQRTNGFTGLPSGAGKARLPPAIAKMVRAQAAKLGLDQDFMQSLAWQEGGTGKISSAGAIGTMQLMPGTADDMQVNPYDESQNISGGESYFLQLLNRFHGNYDVAAAAYNAGPNNPGVIHFAETGDMSQLPGQTRAYVASIDQRRAELQAQNQSGAVHTVKGQADVRISLGGAPPGTRVSSSASGDLFGSAPRVEMPMPAGGGP